MEQLAAANQTAYIIYVQKVGKKLAKSWTFPKSPQTKIPGKNRIRKIQEKSGYKIPGIFEQILLFEHTIGMIHKGEPKKF